MTEEKKTCDLCGLPVEIEGFHLIGKDGDKNFCCEGCMGIYQMLNEDKLDSEDDNE